MSEHIALYRKYRPCKFSEVRGQDHIVSVLNDSVKNGKISHAYLFVGSRGTGKTSVARIFASEIGVSTNDMYEIDAASNRGIDDIKILREGVRSLPFDSKYKVYIIDEVHMLSKDAWGALLKTLEEPPGHVVFILATTEFHKVPETIISRCQVFTFRKASEDANKEMILDIAKKENFALDPGGAELLAVLGDGSFRDGLGALQKVLNFYKGSKKITRVDVEKITGAPKTTLVNSFIESIIEERLDKGIESVEQAVKEGLDIKLFMKLILMKFRMAIILKYAPGLLDDNIPKEDLEFLKELLEKDKKTKLRANTLGLLLDAYANIGNSFIDSLPLELALIKSIKE